MVDIFEVKLPSAMPKVTIPLDLGPTSSPSGRPRAKWATTFLDKDLSTKFTCALARAGQEMCFYLKEKRHKWRLPVVI